MFLIWEMMDQMNCSLRSVVPLATQQPQNQKKEKEVVQKNNRQVEFKVSMENPGGEGLDTERWVSPAPDRFEIEKLKLELYK